MELDASRTIIECGPAGRQMLHAFHVGVAAMARAGSQLIVDELLLDVEVYQDWLAALDGIASIWVRMDASAGGPGGARTVARSAFWARTRLP